MLFRRNALPRIGLKHATVMRTLFCGCSHSSKIDNIALLIELEFTGNIYYIILYFLYIIVYIRVIDMQIYDKKAIYN